MPLDPAPRCYSYTCDEDALFLIGQSRYPYCLEHAEGFLACLSYLDVDIVVTQEGAEWNAELGRSLLAGERLRREAEDAG